MREREREIKWGVYYDMLASVNPRQQQFITYLVKGAQGLAYKCAAVAFFNVARQHLTY